MRGIHHVVMPEHLALSVRRAQQYQTEIIGRGGAEIRNAARPFARRHYVLETGIISLAQGRALSQFFDARRGRQYGFLLRDWMDFHTGENAPSAADEPVRPVADRPGHFALLKTYPTPEGPRPKRIFKPMADGFKLAVNQQPVEAAADYTLDSQTGTLLLADETVSAADITVGFYFHTAVRFDSDRLEMERVEGDMVRLQPLPLVELVLADA